MKTMKVPPHESMIMPHVPAGALTAGDRIAIGLGVGIVMQTVAAGIRTTVARGGTFDVPKVSAQAWADQAAIYWDSGADLFTTVSTGNKYAGVAVGAAANPSSTGRLNLIQDGRIDAS